MFDEFDGTIISSKQLFVCEAETVMTVQVVQTHAAVHLVITTIRKRKRRKESIKKEGTVSAYYLQCFTKARIYIFLVLMLFCTLWVQASERHFMGATAIPSAVS